MKKVLAAVIMALVVLFLNDTVRGQDAQFAPKLFIGGGALSEEMYMEFCKLTGTDAKLIVIPTATSRAVEKEKIEERWRSRGIKEVSVLHTTDRSVASSDEFIAPLKTATAVWISGGSQYRIADAYLNTPVEQELYKLVQRGGIIGGSSAGAAIQSRVMIRGGKTEPQISTGLDLLEQTIIDQHFLKRNRLSRLIAAVKAHPKLMGLGIDEDTAIIVGDKEYRVIGKSYVIRVELVDGAIQIDAFEDGDAIPIDNR